MPKVTNKASNPASKPATLPVTTAYAATVAASTVTLGTSGKATAPATAGTLYACATPCGGYATFTLPAAILAKAGATALVAGSKTNALWGAGANGGVLPLRAIVAVAGKPGMAVGFMFVVGSKIPTIKVNLYTSYYVLA